MLERIPTINRQLLIGVVGDQSDSPFIRSWIHEMVGDPFLSEVSIIVEVGSSEIEGGVSRLPYDAILYKLNLTAHEKYEEYLIAVMEQDIPVIVDISTDIEDIDSLARFLGRATLVTTTIPSIARGVARRCPKVIVWAENLPGPEITWPTNTNLGLVNSGHWLWIVDDKLDQNLQIEKIAKLGEETQEGTKGTVTIIGPSPDLVIPRWATAIQIPVSILRLGSGAAAVWLASFHVKWDRAIWETEDAWHLSRIYRDLELRRFVGTESGKLSEVGWPEDSLDSSEQRLHQMQITAMLSVFPKLDIVRKESKLVKFEYDQSSPQERQQLAFPSKMRSLPKLSPGNPPLVSILIPAYNRPEYLVQALESALFQTYDNIEIIIGDDSTTNEVESLVRCYYLPKYDNIRYWRNEVNKGQYQNDLDLIEASTGEYLNILMDDDLLHLDKIRLQMEYFLGRDGDNIGFVTSHRAVVDANGLFKNIFASTKELFNSTERISGRAAIENSLRANRNLFGEPTTVLFRKSMLRNDFGSLFGRKYVCNVDHASWLQILQHGDAVFMNDTLSAYRFHDGQQSWTPRAALGGSVDFAHATLGARSAGYLAVSRDFEEAVRRCLDRLRVEQLKIDDILELDKECTELYVTASTYIAELQSILDR